MAQDQRETKDWIKAVASHMGLSPSQLALNSRMAASTLTRWLNDKSNTVGISQSSLEKVASYSGFRPGQYPGRLRGNSLAEPDTLPLEQDNAPHPEWVKAAVASAKAGKNGIEAWVMKGAALDGMGILPGDVVIVDHNRRPKAGDVVIAQILDYSTDTTETVMRLWQPPFIMMHSIRLGPQRPEHVDEERITIHGTMIGAIRLFH